MSRIGKHLGWDAPNVEAGPAKDTGIDDSDFFIIPVGGDNGITGSGTDNGKIVVFDVHAISVMVPNPVSASWLIRRYAGSITTMRSLPSTGVGFCNTTREMVPATGAVILASIFMASMVATVSPTSTFSPSSTDTVTVPENGAGTWPCLEASAFSAS